MKSLKLYRKISTQFIVVASAGSKSISGLRAILRYGTSSGCFFCRSPKFGQCRSMACRQIQLQGSKGWGIPILQIHGTCLGTLQTASLAPYALFSTMDSPPFSSSSSTQKGRKFHSEPKLHAFWKGQPSTLQESQLENSYDDECDKEDENLEDLDNLEVELEDDAKGDDDVPPKPTKEGRLLNSAITARFVRIVTEEGHRVVRREEALKCAREKDLDLVQVDSSADPPVCKIYDYHKEEYKRKQLVKERKKKQMGQGGLKDIKELRFASKTESKDLEVKCQRARNFMDEGHRVKFVALYGADGAKQDLLDRIMPLLEDVAVIEQGPRFESRQAWVLLRHVKFGPLKRKPPKPQPQELTDEEEESIETDEDDYSFGAYCSEEEEEFARIESSPSTEQKAPSARPTAVPRTYTSQPQTSPYNSETPRNETDSKHKFPRPSEQYRPPHPYGDTPKRPSNPGTDLYSSSQQAFEGKRQMQIQDPQKGPPKYPHRNYPPQGAPGVASQQTHVGYPPRSPEGNTPQYSQSPPYSNTRPPYPHAKQPPTPQFPIGNIPPYPQTKQPLAPHTQQSYPHMQPLHDPPQYPRGNYPPQGVPGVTPQQTHFGYPPRSSEGNALQYSQSPPYPNTRPPYPPIKQPLSPQSPTGNIPPYPQTKQPVSPHAQPPPYPQMEPPPYPYTRPSPYHYAQSPPQPSVQGSPQGFLGNMPSQGRGRPQGPEGYSSQNLQRYPEASRGMSPPAPSQSPPDSSYGRGHLLQGSQRHAPPGSPVYPPQGSFGYPPHSSQAQYPQSSQGLDRYPFQGSNKYPPQILGGYPQQGLPAYPPYVSNGHAHQGPGFSPVNHQEKHSPQNPSGSARGLSPGQFSERYPPQNPHDITQHQNRPQDENDGSFRGAES